MSALRNVMVRVARRLPLKTLSGYDDPELVETVFRKTAAYQPDRTWPEIAGARTVLDFGGGCGLHYKEANSERVRWAVVETEPMVARAKEVETDHLKFFTSIAEAASWLGQVEVIHSDGAVQYTNDPLSVVRELCRINADKLLWQRVYFSDDLRGPHEQVSLLSENGPGQIATAMKKIVMARIGIPEVEFMSLHHGYNLVKRGPDWLHFSR